MVTSHQNIATIRDVARKAGVSIATVSRFINHTVPVSEEVAKRIQAVMVELKYVPHAAARNLATHKTNTIGLILTDISGDFFTPLVAGIEETTRQAGLNLLISTTQDASQDDASLHLGPHNTDGLLVFVDGLSGTRLEEVYEMGHPIVLIHRTPPEKMDIPCVTVENKAASNNIVSHLIEVHHRRKIVFLSGQKGHEDSVWRELGYRACLKTHGIPFDPNLVAPGEFDRQVAYQSIYRLITEGIEFDAVFSGDDEAAVGVLMALQSAGKRIPEDVAVVGFDDQNLSSTLTPPLTTVRAPTKDVGRIAARQLIQLIRTGQAERLTLLPTEIVIRRSCGCP